MRIALDGEDFGTLVRGGVVEKAKPIGVTGPYLPVKIVLSDIGFERMDEAIAEAKDARGMTPPRQWRKPPPQQQEGE